MQIVDTRLRVLVLLVALLSGCSLGMQRATRYSKAFTSAAEERLEVLSMSTDGNVVPGVTLQLCPILDGRTAGDSDCALAITDAEGLAVFSGIRAGIYQLRASQVGWADTTIEPLRFRSGDPIPPLRVGVFLNPVCYDCRGYGNVEPGASGDDTPQLAEPDAVAVLLQRL